MLSSAVIVFREVLEAALVVSILLAATRGLSGRFQWIGGGVATGVLGAVVVAMFAGAISNAFEGIGQELLNACVLFAAVFMLAWHNIWMSSHARELVTNLRSIGSKVSVGSLPFYFLSIAAGLAVLREGSEIVLFLYGLVASGDTATALLTGGVIGLAGGVAVGVLLYLGLLKIPASLLFKVTGWMILLLAAGMAATAAGYLSQSGLLPSYKPLWNTSHILSEQSLFGQLLHIMVGYQARPTAIQLGFYVATLIVIATGMQMVGNRDNRNRSRKELPAQ